MIDLLTATQDAVFGALKNAIDPGIAAVFQHIPQDTQPPWVMVGAIDSENAGGKFEQEEKLTIEVQSVFRGAGRAPLLAIMHAVRVALDDQQLAGDSVTFSTVSWLSASVSDVAGDGVTYAGVSNFEVYAEPA